MTKKYKKLVIILVVVVLLIASSLILKQDQTFMQIIDRDKVTKMKREIAIKLGIKIQKDNIVKDVRENTKDFIAIAAFIKNYKKEAEETIFIEKINNNSYIAKISSVKGEEQIKIMDSNIDKSIRHIFSSLHYRYIDEDGGNGIYFTLDDTAIGFGHGVAFSKNSNNLDGWGTDITKAEKIQGDWYYFEAK